MPRPRASFVATLTAVIVTIATMGLGSAAPAFANCPQMDDFGIFTVSQAGENNGHGDRAGITVKDMPFGDCTTGNTPLVAEGTAHMHVGPTGSGDFAEIGWIEWTPGSGIKEHDLFWEVSFNGQGDTAHIFSSGCAGPPGKVSTFRVGQKGSTTQWAMSYACDGGAFTQIALSQSLGHGAGDPRGETTHHSNPVPTNGLDDHFQNLQWRDSSDAWNLWGGVGCDDDGGLANFWADVVSGHEYYTKDGSGFC